LGLPSAIGILLLRSVLKVLLMGEFPSDWIGMPMNIVAMAVFVVGIWFFIKKDDVFSLKHFILGGAIGTIALTAVMALLNAVWAVPMYMELMHFGIPMSMTKWIITMVLPFNLIQGVVLTAVALLILVPISKYLEGQRRKYA
jgi:riboflavin transporter FmnP